MQIQLAGIRLRAERRAGELLAEMEKAKGTQGQLVGRGSSGGHTVRPPEESPPTLTEIRLRAARRGPLGEDLSASSEPIRVVQRRWPIALAGPLTLALVLTQVLVLTLALVPLTLALVLVLVLLTLALLTLALARCMTHEQVVGWQLVAFDVVTVGHEEHLGVADTADVVGGALLGRVLPETCDLRQRCIAALALLCRSAAVVLTHAVLLSSLVISATCSSVVRDHVELVGVMM
jgi:hypothetical protein